MSPPPPRSSATSASTTRSRQNFVVDENETNVAARPFCQPLAQRAYLSNPKPLVGSRQGLLPKLDLIPSAGA